MNANEIVRKLRGYSQELVAYKLGCEYADNINDAAALIESLQAQLTASKRRERAAVNNLCGACGALTRATGHGWEDSCYKCQWWRGVKEEME